MDPEVEKQSTRGSSGDSKKEAPAEASSPLKTTPLSLSKMMDTDAKERPEQTTGANLKRKAASSGDSTSSEVFNAKKVKVAETEVAAIKASSTSSLNDSGNEASSGKVTAEAAAAPSTVENEATEASPSKSARENQYLIKSLRLHLGLTENPGEKPNARPSPRQPRIWVEVTPPSPRGSKCQGDCTENCMPGEYRIAVNPGQYSSTDYYHIRCFEDIADFSQADVLNCLQPVTRIFFRSRNVNISSILDGNYLVDGGGERLILEWKDTMQKLIKKRDGVQIENMDSDLSDLQIPRPRMSWHESLLLTNDLAPIESDGPDDSDEWSLFEEFMTIAEDDVEDLNDRHSLSYTLRMWRLAVKIAFTGPANLSEEGKELAEKLELTPKAIKGIKRLYSTPMPDIQGMMHGVF